MRNRITRALPWLALTGVVSLLCSVVVLFLPVTAAAAPASSKVTLKRTMDKDYDLRVPGRDHTASVTVSQTTGLVRQRVKVSWSGLMPTDPRNAPYGNYPVVVMQCWGTPAEVTQQTCWNGGMQLGTNLSNSLVDPGPLDKAIFGENPGNYTPVPFKARDDGKLYTGFPTAPGWPRGAVETHNPSAFSPATQNAVIPPKYQGFTNENTTGEADIELLTGFENPHLGCSSTAACSLVVIPIGDPRCKPNKELPRYLQGICVAGRSGVRGAENWITPTNWSRRFVFPLSFRESSATCQMDNRQESGFAGSTYAFQLLNNSWRTKFCHDPALFRLGYSALPDGDARSLFTAALRGTWQDGSTNALLTSRPLSGDPPKPVVYAPVTMTGVAVSFVLDDENRKEVTQLNLNARLLAKMITQSYRTAAGNSESHPALRNNPTWWGSDPEFLALNPRLKRVDATLDRAEAVYPVVSLGDMDAIYALTSYIAADKDAVAWLNGGNDGYGMFVNPKFHNYQLPIGLLELRDDFVLDNVNSNLNKQILLSAYANVADNLYNAAIAVAQAWSYANTATSCLDEHRPETCILKRVANRQNGGFRALLAITTLGDSTVFGLRQASLATPSGTFVKPDDYSLELALRGTKLDEKTGVLSTDFPKLHPLAYPGLSVVYAAIPTTGLSATTAGNYATFLEYAAGPGQVPGLAAGQLPSGYVPLSDPMREQARNAAVAVREQKGAVPAPPPALSTDPAAGLLPPPGSTNDPGTGNQAPRDGSPAGTSSAPGASSAPSTVHQPMTSVATQADSSRLAKWLLPGLLGLGVLAGVVAFGVTVSTERQHPLRRALRAVLRRS